MEQQGKVDIAHSLSPFIAVLNEDGTVLASTGQLNNEPPKIPQGALNVAKQQGKNRITWMPNPEVRSALVITRYGGDKPGLVVVGRSLSEVENRIQDLTKMIAIG